MDLKISSEIALITFAFMMLDVITGYVGAWVSKTVSSSKMREGLGHKTALICIIALGALIDFAQSKQIIDLGYNIPCFSTICIYICFMEINSMLENIAIIFPSLKDSKLMNIFSNNSNYLKKLVDSITSKDAKQIETTPKHAKADAPTIQPTTTQPQKDTLPQSNDTNSPMMLMPTKE